VNSFIVENNINYGANAGKKIIYLLKYQTESNRVTERKHTTTYTVKRNSYASISE